MTRVIKIGGRAQGAAALPAVISRACAGDRRTCIVHGGGDEVTTLQRQLGREPTFHNGRRVTTPGDLLLVRMVLSGTINKRLVGQFLADGIRAAGISGEDAGLLGCTPFGGGTLGAVGEPTIVDPAVIEALFHGGFIPVISPLGRLVVGSGQDDRGCNVNGDDAAAAIAVALRADELLLVADVEGVLMADGSCLDLVDSDQIPGLIETGAATGGMIAKLEAGLRALRGGVLRVRIGGLDAINDSRSGTTIVPVALRATMN